MIYYETAKDLQCTGRGTQYPPAKCMAADVNVFAGKGKVAIPTETVRALCKFFIRALCELLRVSK